MNTYFKVAMVVVVAISSQAWAKSAVRAAKAAKTVSSDVTYITRVTGVTNPPAGASLATVSPGGIITISPQVKTGTVATATTSIMTALGLILTAANSDFDHVLGTVIYLTSLSDLPAVNTVYARSFTGGVPARQVVQIPALPGGAKVGISMVAMASSGGGVS